MPQLARVARLMGSQHVGGFTYWRGDEDVSGVAGDWTNAGGGLWTRTVSGYLITGNDTILYVDGVRYVRVTGTPAAGQFKYDSSTSTLTVPSASNPGSSGRRYDLSILPVCVDFTGHDNTSINHSIAMRGQRSIIINGANQTIGPGVKAMESVRSGLRIEAATGFDIHASFIALNNGITAGATSLASGILATAGATHIGTIRGYVDGAGADGVELNGDTGAGVLYVIDLIVRNVIEDILDSKLGAGSHLVYLRVNGICPQQGLNLHVAAHDVQGSDSIFIGVWYGVDVDSGVKLTSTRDWFTGGQKGPAISIFNGDAACAFSYGVGTNDNVDFSTGERVGDKRAALGVVTGGGTFDHMTLPRLDTVSGHNTDGAVHLVSSASPVTLSNSIVYAAAQPPLVVENTTGHSLDNNNCFWRADGGTVWGVINGVNKTKAQMQALFPMCQFVDPQFTSVARGALNLRPLNSAVAALGAYA